MFKAKWVGILWLSQIQGGGLELISADDEIKRAVWACNWTKATGYDEKNLGFIKKMWGTVREDFIKMIVDFFEKGTLPKSVNTTWVTLIP